MELKRIVNIMTDEKFLDYYIEMSEKFIPGESSYVFFTNNSELKHVKSQNKNILKIPYEERNSEEVLSSLCKADKVIFHSFYEELGPLIKNISGKVILIWLFWGWEGYITRKKSEFLENLTRKIRFEKSFTGFLKYIKNFFYNDLVIVKTGRKHIDIIRKIDYCATWVTGDYDFAKSINPDLKWIYFNYYTNELMSFPTGGKIDPSLQKIMLGNSGSNYNNHAEALHYLKEINFSGVIYCPMSYGGNVFYKNNIENLGKKFFGDNFILLKTFIPLNEYQNILNSCDVIWMNHKRQQAAGNIFAGFCTGKVVILHPNNPMRSTFEKWGMKFFDKEVMLNKKFNVIDLERNSRLKNELAIDANKDFFNFL